MIVVALVSVMILEQLGAVGVVELRLVFRSALMEQVHALEKHEFDWLPVKSLIQEFIIRTNLGLPWMER